MNWVITQHQFVWNNEQQFLNYLRRKLPVITGGGTITSFTTTGSSGAATFAGGVLNIPVYSGGGGGNLDATLALGGSLTADRTITYATRNLINSGAHIQYTSLDPSTIPIHLYPAFPGGLKERLILNNTVNDVSWDIRYDISGSGGPPSDLVCIQGWNADSQFSGSLPSWTTRMEYQYQGHFYEYHLQWSNSGGSRTYRNMSFTMVDNGSTATDTCLVFLTSNDFEVRTLAGSAYTTATNASATDFTSFTVSNAAATRGLSIVADTVNSVIAIRPSPVAAVPLYFQTWSSVYFTGSNTGPYANGPGNVLGFNNFFDVATGGNFTWDTAGNDMHFYYGSHWNGSIAPFYQIFSNNTGEWTQLFRSTGGYFWQVQSHNDAGAVVSTPLRIDPALMTMGVQVNFTAATTARAIMALAVGGPPTSPTDGMIWFESNTNTGLKIRVNGVTKSFTLA